MKVRAGGTNTKHPAPENIDIEKREAVLEIS
jgi:hypothetical protein